MPFKGWPNPLTYGLMEVLLPKQSLEEAGYP